MRLDLSTYTDPLACADLLAATYLRSANATLKRVDEHARRPNRKPIVIHRACRRGAPAPWGVQDLLECPGHGLVR